MPLPTDGHIQLFRQVDVDGNPARVSLIAGVYRLAVDAVVVGGGILDEDADDDSIASAQTLLLSIVENYQFDGTVWRRDQARAANTAIDQDLMYKLCRAAVSGIDSSAAAGSEVTAVEARSGGLSPAYTTSLVGLLTKSMLHGIDAGTGNFEAISERTPGAFDGVDYDTPRSLIVSACLFGEDNTGANIARAVEARNANAEADFAGTLIGLLTQARCASFDGTDWVRNLARPANTAIDQALDYGLVRAAVSGVDADGAVGSEVIAVNADQMSASLLANVENGIQTLSKIFAERIATSEVTELQSDRYNVVSGTATSSPIALYTTSLVTGIDNTGAALLRPVEARDFSANADVASTLIGLLTNNRPSFFDLNTTDFLRQTGDTASNLGGRATTTVNAAHALSILYGFDNTGAAVLRPVEARDFTVPGDVASSLIGLLTNSRLSVFDDIADDFDAVGALSLFSGLGQRTAPWFLQHRKSGYSASRLGNRFSFTSGANLIAGTTSFVATTPQVILVGGATNDHVIRRIKVSLGVAGGAAPVTVRVVIDTADRYTSGGTARTPANENTTSATAAGGDHYVDGGITASAAGGGTRELKGHILENAVGAFVEFDLEDGVIIGVSDSLLIYWYDNGTTAPECLYEVQFEEANVQ